MPGRPSSDKTFHAQAENTVLAHPRRASPNPPPTSPFIMPERVAKTDAFTQINEVRSGLRSVQNAERGMGAR